MSAGSSLHPWTLAAGFPEQPVHGDLRRGCERGDRGWERGDEARAFQNGTLLAPPTHSPLPTRRPTRAPWERGGGGGKSQSGRQTDRQKDRQKKAPVRRTVD